MSDCDCLSGRSRIGTRTDKPQSINEATLRLPFGAIEDWNPRPGYCCPNSRALRLPFGAIEDWNYYWQHVTRSVTGIAIAFRGDRGLELNKEPRSPLAAIGLRLPFGAIEDWNGEVHRELRSFIILRLPFGAIEDWNDKKLSEQDSRILRLPFGAIEDWNIISARDVRALKHCDCLSGRSRIGTVQESANI